MKQLLPVLLALGARLASSLSTDVSTIDRRAPNVRSVTIPVAVDPRSSLTDPTTGKPVLNTNFKLAVPGLGSESGIQLKVASNFYAQNSKFLFEQGLPATSFPTAIQRTTYIVGTTTLSDDQIWQAFTEVMADQAGWVDGTMADQVIVRKMLAKLQIEMPPEVQSLMDKGATWWRVARRPVQTPRSIQAMKDVYTVQDKTANAVKATRVRRLWQNGQLVPIDQYPDGARKVFSTSMPDRSLKVVDLTPPSNPARGRLLGCFGMKRSLDPRGSCDGGSDPAAADDQIYTSKPPTSVALGRVGGTLAALPVVEAAGAILTTAAVVAGPLIVILDFVNGNPVGGAFGAVGVAIGEWGILLASGPEAVLAVGLIAALFFILPGLFQSSSATTYPSATNITEIIQFAMFGDPSHTGNEKCRQGSPGQAGNPNCTALYGPSVLATSLKWDNFDAVVFTINENAGYPMAISDIAAGFDLASGSGPSSSVATISCQPPPYVCLRFNCPGPQRNKCGKPTFTLNRAAATLPILNKTADQIFNRMIPKPGGDCKLVSDAAGVTLDEYNLTLTGSAAAIACNVSASLNIDGNAVPINDANANNGQPAALFAPANASTDGLVHQVAAPNATGFTTVLNSTNAACLDGSGGHICLPNGTYSSQTGSLGFDSSKVDSLVIPPGAALSLTVPESKGRTSVTSLVPYHYTTNKTASDPMFHKNMAAIAAVILGSKSFDITVATTITTPPVACLFTQPQYLGDVACYGPGGGNVSSQVAGSAQSVTVLGGATVWMYAEFYGDDAGQSTTVSVPDLSIIPLGDDNMSKKIVALWISTLQ